MENLKVFELAKKMGMETIALMDKLREFKIPIKNHMAELDSGLLEQIKARFDEEEKAKSAKVAKPKTARKKAAATTAEPAVPKVIKATAAPKVPKKEAAPKAETALAAKASSRTVIRRKANVPEQAIEEKPATPLSEAEKLFAPQPTPTSAQNAAGVSAQTRTAPSESVAGRASVIARIDLKETMGEAVAPRAQAEESAPREAAGTQQATDAQKFDREEIGKLIKQEALAQARKAAGHKETRVETFNASDFRKRELLFQPKKKKVLTGRPAQKTQITKPSAAKRKIKIEGGISVSGLAQAMSVKGNAVIKQLMNVGSMVSLNDILDFETAQIVAAEHGFEVENVALSEEQMIAKAKPQTDSGQAVLRPPVVTVMGHVDHGKTSLLDAIRKTDVAAGEAGGITQHIGAYSVEANGKKITFLDTPGHEAFTAMRARGAKVTDIVVLVVAADDGIMPQTREAVQHAKAAGVPIIVAVNKMDLPSANPQKVLQGLTEFELVPEEWGGTTIVAKVSAAKKEGIKELLEMILLQAEVLELKADPRCAASGAVIESRLDRGRGPVATLLIQKGTVTVGDNIVAGFAMGRVRAMINDKGQNVKEAGPGDPVEIIGLSSVPNAGDSFDVVSSEDTAKEIIEKRTQKAKEDGGTGTPMKMSLEELFAKVQESDVKELPILIKADVHGSAEALKDMLTKIPADKVRVKVLSSGVGGITESDVLLASASKAVIVGFNVRPESGVGAVAEREGVEIKTYSIIYEVVEEVKRAMTGMLKPTFVEKALGRAEVRSLFNVPKVGTIAGCAVTDGRITRQAQVRLLRDSRVVYEGKLSSLKRFKDDVREVQNGYECGIGIENYNDLKVGDVIEAFTKEQVTATLG